MAGSLHLIDIINRVHAYIDYFSGYILADIRDILLIDYILNN